MTTFDSDIACGFAAECVGRAKSLTAYYASEG